jgi:hypothetical protein
MAAGRFYSAQAQPMVLTAPLSDSALSMTVDAVVGLPLQYPFTVVIEPDTSSEEIVSVTNVAGVTLTIERGYDGATPSAHAASVTARHMVTAQDLRTMAEHVGAEDGVHGLAPGDDVAGVSKTQVLTNKTMDSANNSMTIRNAALATDAVTADKIAAGAVGSSEIADDAVGTAEIADNAVTAAQIASGAVGTDEIAPNAVGASEIAAGAVGTSELADDSITTAKILPSGSVTGGFANGATWAVDTLYGLDLGNGMAFVRITFHRTTSTLGVGDDGNVGNSLVGTLPASLRGARGIAAPLTSALGERGAFGYVNPDNGEVYITAVGGFSDILVADSLDLSGVYPLI